MSFLLHFRQSFVSVQCSCSPISFAWGLVFRLFLLFLLFLFRSHIYMPIWWNSCTTQIETVSKIFNFRLVVEKSEAANLFHIINTLLKINNVRIDNFSTEKLNLKSLLTVSIDFYFDVQIFRYTYTFYVLFLYMGACFVTFGTRWFMYDRFGQIRSKAEHTYINNWFLFSYVHFLHYFHWCASIFLLPSQIISPFPHQIHILRTPLFPFRALSLALLRGAYIMTLISGPPYNLLSVWACAFVWWRHQFRAQYVR